MESRYFQHEEIAEKAAEKAIEKRKKEQEAKDSGFRGPDQQFLVLATS